MAPEPASIPIAVIVTLPGTMLPTIAKDSANDIKKVMSSAQ
jgi:hypothetical protein